MKAQDAMLKRYYRAIKRELLCPREIKRKILDELQQNISSYQEETPNADLEAIQKHFGTPRQIANAYLEEMSVPELSKNLRIRKKIIAIILVTLITAISILGTAVGIALMSSISSSHGYIEMYPVTVDERNGVK